jgi:hypothetical protein
MRAAAPAVVAPFPVFCYAVVKGSSTGYPDDHDHSGARADCKGRLLVPVVMRREVLYELCGSYLYWVPESVLSRILYDHIVQGLSN